MKIGPIRIATAHTLSMGLAVVLCSAVAVGAQEPAAPAPRSAARSSTRPRTNRGRALWATHCVQCHGPQARGSDTGPNIIRTKTANYDRSAAQAGSVLGPFLGPGTRREGSGRVVHGRRDRRPRELPAAARQRHDARVAGVHRGRHRHRERRSRRGVLQRRRRLRHVPHRLGAQPRRHRHAHSRPVDLQQRMLFPNTGGRGRAGRARGAAPAAGAPAAAPAADRNAVTVSIASGSGAPLSGVLVEESDFYVTLRAADGTVRTVRRGPGVRVTKTNRCRPTSICSIASPMRRSTIWWPTWRR